MLPWGVAGAGPSSVLPLAPTGALGALETDALPHAIAFDTSAGGYTVDGVARNDEAHRESIQLPAMERSVWVFDFEALTLGPLTTVTATGSSPLVLLSRGDAIVDAAFLLDGAPGAAAGKGAGGGGGGGGGAVAILAGGVLSFGGKISVNGGAGGVGNDGVDAVSFYHGGAGGAGIALLGSAQKTRDHGSVSAGSDADALGFVGPVEIGPGGTFNGAAIHLAQRGVSVVPTLRAEEFSLYGGAGGAGGGGSGLPYGDDRTGYADHGGAPGVGGPGGAPGGAGGYAVAGGAGGAGGPCVQSGCGGGGGGGGGAAIGAPGQGGHSFGNGTDGSGGSPATLMDGGAGGNGGGNGSGDGGHGGTLLIPTLASCTNGAAGTLKGAGGGGGGGGSLAGSGCSGGDGNRGGGSGGGGGGGDALDVGGAVGAGGNGGRGGAGTLPLAFGRADARILRADVGQTLLARPWD